VGTVVLQVPIGWAADVWSRRGMLIVCAALTILGAALLPFAIDAGLVLWALLAVWGGIVFAIYTVALGLLGERFAPAELALVNAAFIMAYNTGAGLGPVTAGALMEAWSPDGMTVVVAASGLMVLLAAFFRRA
jgi:MFS family permease